MVVIHVLCRLSFAEPLLNSFRRFLLREHVITSGATGILFDGDPLDFLE